MAIVRIKHLSTGQAPQSELNAPGITMMMRMAPRKKNGLGHTKVDMKTSADTVESNLVPPFHKIYILGRTRPLPIWDRESATTLLSAIRYLLVSFHQLALMQH